nr:hypothetical protein BaRGS_027634 [Batillaria attramentaria]
MKAVSELTKPTGVFGYGEEEVTAMLTTVSWKTTPGAGPSLMLWGAIGHNQVLGPVIFQRLVLDAATASQRSGSKLVKDDIVRDLVFESTETI